MMQASYKSSLKFWTKVCAGPSGTVCGVRSTIPMFLQHSSASDCLSISRSNGVGDMALFGTK